MLEGPQWEWGHHQHSRTMEANAGAEEMEDRVLTRWGEGKWPSMLILSEVRARNGGRSRRR